MNNNFFNPNLFGNPIPTRGIPSIGSKGLSSLFGSAPRAVAQAGTAASKITFSGILNGASKTLGVINQAIPVFYQVKPIWNNARTIFRVTKELNSSNNSTNNYTTSSNSNTQNTETKKESNSNSPTFFI